MKMKFQKKGLTLIVSISAEVDHHIAEECREKIEKELDKFQGKSIIFDFSDVTFMDSSGIGMVIGRYKYTLAQGGRTAIVCRNEKVKQIFQLSALFQLIPCYDTIGEALKYTNQEGFLNEI